MPSNLRNLRDKALLISKAIPAQNTNTNSDAIDLGSASPWADVENVDFEVVLPAQATMTTGQTITATIQDSADNSSFAAVARLATIVQTGASSAGPLVTAIVKLPRNVRRYLRINIACSATAGESLAGNATLQPLL
jgi:hypothetical protein